MSAGNTPQSENDAADSFLGAFPGLVSEINAWANALPDAIREINDRAAALEARGAVSSPLRERLLRWWRARNA